MGAGMIFKGKKACNDRRTMVEIRPPASFTADGGPQNLVNSDPNAGRPAFLCVDCELIG